MGITREELNARLADLEAHMPELLQRVAAQTAAIGETKRWLAELDKREMEQAEATQQAAIETGRANLEGVQ